MCILCIGLMVNWNSLIDWSHIFNFGGFSNLSSSKVKCSDWKSEVRPNLSIIIKVRPCLYNSASLLDTISAWGNPFLPFFWILLLWFFLIIHFMDYCLHFRSILINYHFYLNRALIMCRAISSWHAMLARIDHCSLLIIKEVEEFPVLVSKGDFKVSSAYRPHGTVSIVFILGNHIRSKLTEGAHATRN